MNKILAACSLLPVALFISACCNMQPDAASTAKCKTSASSDACSTCCKAQGRNGHTYTGGSGCNCL